MISSMGALIACLGVLGFLAVGDAGEFRPPVKLTAGGKPVDVQHSGHSAPFVGDFDGDGLDDLLVGHSAGGV